MKATGIVRRIDDLGRIVIPKEIRRTMRIREGDPLEIYTDRDGEVIFKKYSPVGELSGFAAHICDTLNKTTGHTAVVCDRDTIIAVSGNGKREIMDKRISQEVEELIQARRMYQAKQNEPRFKICENGGFVAIAAPIISEGDVSGAVSFITQNADELLSDTEYKLTQTVAGFLGKQMES